MSAVIDETVEVIDRSLDGLRDEIRRLEGARQALAGRRPSQARITNVRRRKARAGSATIPRARRGERSKAAPDARRGSRARRGQREAQALATVGSNPGITTALAAGLLGIDRTQAYGLFRRLEGYGRIRGSHREGWRVPESDPRQERTM